MGRRSATLLASVIGTLLVSMTPAWAEGNYPPGAVGGTEVGGVKSGTISGSGLPHTGFDFTVLWVGLTVLLLGILLLATTRRRGASDGQ
jgi:hypothetical protein